MRDEVISLITKAEENITNFEKEVFINDRGFYMNAKTMIDDMIEQIGIIKQTTELEDYNDEIYNANKEDLTFIIDTLNQLRDLVKTKTIHVIIEGKGNYRIQILGEKEIEFDMNENKKEEIIDLVPDVNPSMEIPTKDVKLDEIAIDDFFNQN